MTADDLNARLLRTFIGELEEQVGVFENALLALERDLANTEQMKALFRAAHTIKGAARILGLDPIENACHSLESFLADVREGRAELAAEPLQLLFRAADALSDARRRLAAGEPLDGAPIATIEPELRRLSRAGARRPAESPRRVPMPPAGVVRTASESAPAAGGESAGATSGRAAPTRRAGSAAELPAASPPPAAADAEAPRAAAHAAGEADVVRVDAARLESLHGSAGDLLVAAARLDERLKELQALRTFVDDWTTDWRAARPRYSGVDDLLLDLDARLERLRTGVVQIERTIRDDARALRRVSDDVGGDVRGLRLRPVADAFQALPRAARDVAAAAGKLVRLEIEDGDVEADRVVVDALREPLLHIVRNAIDHGIEAPADRRRAGKPETGTVRVRAAFTEGRITVTVADDGRGLDIATLRHRFAQRGIPAPESDRDLARALLAGGVSSRGTATQISGRGVGLDLVRSAVERIRGSVNVRWTEGRGTTFVLESPPSPSSLRAVLVTCGQQILALPSLHIDRLLRVKPESVRSAEGRSVIVTDGGPVPIVALSAVLGPPLAPPRAEGTLPVVLVEVAERRLALVVDGFEAERQIVVRPLEGAAARVRNIAGGALLHSGQLALVVNVPGVVAAADRSHGVTTGGRDKATPQRQRILVADDSITTRTLEQSLLEAAGYDVITAVDGLDAWRHLQEQGADLVVADVEMPRMDGFVLCETIRRSDRLRGTPVILVTGLEAPEHRARGLAAGADAYIAKSAFDQEQLLTTIRELLD
jgi:two-component system, chemotaxis family, sensor kinase CheA